MSRKLKRRSIEKAIAAMSAELGAASPVLVVGRVDGPLVRALALEQPFAAALVFDADSIAHARKVCATVEFVDPDAAELPEAAKSMHFELIIFDGALEYFSNPSGILRNVRAALSERGAVVAAIPNIAHGAIRLAVLKGALDKNYVGVAGAREAEEMFERAGFEIESICRVLSPVFGDSSDLPRVERAQFSAAVVRTVEADPEAETSLILIRAVAGGVDSEHTSTEAVAPPLVQRHTGNMGEVPDDEEITSPFELAFEARRRETLLERELDEALAELDRERGRVIAIEAQSHEELVAVKAELAESKAALAKALEKVAEFETRLKRLANAP